MVRRHCFSLTSLLSLLLLVATVVLWVQTRSKPYVVRWTSTRWLGAQNLDHASVYIQCGEGHLTVASGRYHDTFSFTGLPPSQRDRFLTDYSRALPEGRSWRWFQANQPSVFSSHERSEAQINSHGFFLCAKSGPYNLQWAKGIGMSGTRLQLDFMIPVWSLVVLVLVLPVLIFSRWAKARYRSKRSTCLACGYNLTGNTSGVCPECGTTIGLKSVLSKIPDISSCPTARSRVLVQLDIASDVLRSNRLRLEVWIGDEFPGN